MVPLVALAIRASTVTIDPQAIDSTWEGWGTSLCWMGKMFGERDDVADLFFTRKTVTIGNDKLPGLGLNIVRYNAGACSWNEVDGRKMVVSKTIQPFRQMEGFWLDPKDANPDSPSWNWSLDQAQREMMAKAKKRGANRFELFSNSPMWWMCANDNPSGAADPEVDNLRPDQYDNFAIYLANVAKRAKDKWGITFTTVAPFNEPASKWWDANCKQEGCHFSAAAQANLLPRLRRELDARGLKKMPLSASDETHVTHAINTWTSFGPEIRSLVSQVNVHGYEGEKSPREALRSALGDQKLWLSEHGENDRTGMSLARALHLDLTQLRPTAWCYWQPLDGSGWGFLDSDVPRSRILKATTKYYVMAQYARHIRPGMSMLRTGDLNTLAAYDSKGKKLVLVALNGPSAAEKTFDLSRFSVDAGSVDRWITETKGAARYEKRPGAKVAARELKVELPPDSVQTFEISNVTLK